MLVLGVVTPCELVDTNVSEENSVSIFSPEDGDGMFLRNVCIYLQVHTALLPSRLSSTSSLP
jgi:hypothetical protein